MIPLAERNDILAAANAARVYLRHYARGSYHVPRVHPLQHLRPSARGAEKVRYLQNLFPGARLQGRNPRRQEIELVRRALW